MYIRRIPMSEVPDDEIEAEKWLHELYVRKDKLQSSFRETGDFFKTSGVDPLEQTVVHPSLTVLINVLLWNVVTFILMTHFLTSVLASGSMMSISLTCAIFFFCEYFPCFKEHKSEMFRPWHSLQVPEVLG
jgi:lysophosphatidic acid acyltransferase / lysophosphatidylinositol acyltransferase